MHSNENPFTPLAISGSPQGYVSLVESLVTMGLETVTFDKFDPNCSHLLLRHDVDIDIEAALEMALLERTCGWRATYFVMVSSPFYNLFAEEAQNCIRSIVEAGHEIGLHFDPTVYRNSSSDIAVSGEKRCMELVSGLPVRFVTPHRPARFASEWLGNPFCPAGLTNGYAPKYFLETCYLSDSDGTWRNGAPEDVFKRCGKSALQLLTHPHLWKGGAEGRDQSIERSLAACSRELYDAACAHFAGFERGDL